MMWGQLELVVEATPPTTDNNAPTTIPCLSIKSHITIGRRPGADILISNPCISATHCVISKSQLKSTMEYRPRQNEAQPAVTSLALHHVVVWEYTLADMSTNGCFVNGTLVGKGRVCALRDGDEVQLVRAAPEKSNKYNLVYCFRAAGEEVSQVQPSEVAVPVVMAEDIEVEVIQHRLLSQRKQQDDEERSVGPSVSVALLEQHVAEDIAVGSGAICAEEEHIASQSQQSPLLPPHSHLADDTFAACGFSRETTTEVLRKRHEGLVELFYTLDKKSPLGQGSFASVYSASLLDDMSNKPACVLRALGKALPGYTDDESLDSVFQRLLVYRFAVKVIKKSRFLAAAESQEDPLHMSSQGQREIVEKLLDRTGEGAILSSQEKKVLFLQLTPESRKQVERELKDRQRQQREIDILCSVRHPNIIGLFEIFDSPAQLSFVMERCEGGELFPFVQMYGALPEFFVKMIVYQVLLGVQYLHQVGIAHRDLKLENVLLSRPTSIPTLCQLQRDAALMQRSAVTQPHAVGGGAMHAPPKRDRHGVTVPTVVGGEAARDIRDWYHSNVLVQPSWWPEVKISDFGLSRAMDAVEGLGSGSPTAMSTMCGTPLYAAPEVTITSLRINAGGYTEAVDLFSVGVLCFAMLCGRPPFPNVRDAQGRSHKGKLDYLAPLTWERKQNTDNLPKGDGGAVDFRHVPFVRVSNEGRDFTAKLLRLRPLERMSATEALQHPWLRDCHQMIGKPM